MRVLCIPDLHIPFEHQDALRFVIAVAKKYKPDLYINLGDEVDMHAMSDYDHDPDGYSPGHELEKSIEKLKAWYKKFPWMLVCTSNHTSRPFRRAFKYGLPKKLIKGYREFLEAPIGWVWRDNFEMDGVVYEHGEGFSGQTGAIKAALANMQSTVIGHLHSWAGIQFSANEKHLIFGANAGCLIDKDKYAFAYGKKLKSKPIIGCMMIIDGIPSFIPMLLNRRGRWVNKL